MRTFKHFVYGLFYLAIFGGIFFWIYSAFFGSPSIKPSANTPAVGGLEIVGQPMVFHPTPSSVSVMVQIQNPNQALAGKKFSYKFTLLDGSGNPVPNGEINGDSFIYAGEIKYVAEFNKPFPDSSNIVSADFSIVGEPEWVDQSLFAKPEIDLQNSSTSLSGSDIGISGSVINNGTVSASGAEILAIIYSNIGQPAGISKTEINGIAPGGQQAFSITHPMLGNINPSATKIYIYGY